MTSNLNEFKADHSGGDVVKGSEVMDPVTPAGGEIKKRRADLMKSADPTADKLDVKTPGEGASYTESFNSLFEGLDLSEEFKSNLEVVFEAAVNEASSLKAEAVKTELQEKYDAAITEVSEKFEAEISETIDDVMEGLITSLNGYLDYVIKEWMEENKLAVESGIKVEMAESFMEGLKGLFYEHNVNIDEETVDVVASLEEQLAKANTAANRAITESLALKEELKAAQREKALMEMTEGLTVSQVERLKTLSENVRFDDEDDYKEKVALIKESFFKKETVARAPVKTDSEVLIENTVDTAPKADRFAVKDDTIAALAAAMSGIR